MKYLNILLWVTLIFLFLASCVNDTKKPDESEGNKHKPTQIIEPDETQLTDQEKVVVENDVKVPEIIPAEKTATKEAKPVESLKGFSVFEPDIRDDPSGLPVIIFIDAHANGDFPVKLYQGLAKEYGFLLIGSNEIQNGMPGKEVVASFDGLLKTLKSDFPINKNRIYLMGFSGGARLCLAFAEAYPEISAVVACGAGIQSGVKAPGPTFSFMGMAGNEDFNMIEIINTDRVLKREGFQPALVLFDGDHNWPQPVVAREVFQWLDLTAMKEKAKPIDKGEIKKAEDWYMQKIDELVEVDRIFYGHEVADRASKVLAGLTDVSVLNAIAKDLRNNPVFSEQLNEMVKSMQMEMGLQNSYVQAFDDKDVVWWGDEIKKLNVETVPQAEQLMQKRLLAYLGVMAYMISNKAVSEKDLENAENYLSIYRLIEPTNPEHVYLEAKRRMLLNEQKSALNYLRLAVVLGFNDKYRLYNDPAFSPLKDNPDFKTLME